MNGYHQLCQGCVGAALDAVDAEVAVHAGDEVWAELGERVAAVRAALMSPPIVGGADGGMQLVVVEKRP